MPHQNKVRRNKLTGKILRLLVLPVLAGGSNVSAEPLKGNVQRQDVTPVSGDIFQDNELELLPAGIQFSETVAPVGQDLRPHKLFSSVTLPAEDGEDTWYQIPAWRAGEFHREKQLDHTQFGDVESVSKVDHVYGMQVDRKGGIWHHMSWPGITKVSLDGYSQYKIINRYEPVSLKANEFCVKISSTNIDVDDKSGKITRVARQEEFDAYYPGAAGTAMGKCWIKGFSQHGRTNTTIERCTVEEVRVKPFVVINSFRGRDLRESFRRYLSAHDMADLIPETIALPSARN
jgi:hypothetical protein